MDKHVGVSGINCITKNLKHGEVDCTSFIDEPDRQWFGTDSELRKLELIGDFDEWMGEIEVYSRGSNGF